MSGELTYGLEENKLSYLADEYAEKGFGYADYKESDGYGISLSSPSFVLSMIEKMPDLRVISFTEKAWDDHQDVICCIKDPFMNITAEKTGEVSRVRLARGKDIVLTQEK